MLFAAEKWKDQKTKAKTNKTNQPIKQNQGEKIYVLNR